MKTRLIIAVAALASTAWAAADVVEIGQLPRAVQNTLKTQKGADAIKDIEKKTEDGRVVYEVEFTRDGFNPVLWIGEDGAVVRDTRNDGVKGGVYAESRGRIRTLKDADVPPAVQKTVQAHAQGRAVADVDRETWNGRTVYEVEFAQTGRNAQIHVAEDGTVVKDERAGKGLKGLFMGTQLEETPAAVQETIRREGAGREIADIDKEQRNGMTLYEVEFRQPGRNVELHIAENGSIVRDSRQDRAVGTPGTETVVGSERREASLTVSDLPKAVEEKLISVGPLSTIKKIERKTRDGRWYYEVQFERDGLDKTVEISEDGSDLRD